MTAFARAAALRAACAAVWCLPGALWWAAPALGAALPLRGVVYPDPRTFGALVCGNTTAGEAFRGALRWQAGRWHPALVDSLVHGAEDPGAGGSRRRVAREALAASGQPRALAHLVRTGAVPLAPILVRPGRAP